MKLEGGYRRLFVGSRGGCALDKKAAEKKVRSVDFCVECSGANQSVYKQ